MAQEPDYRQMTDVQLKYELKKLEYNILSNIGHYTAGMTDKELGCANDLDDGTTWGEAWLRIPPLETFYNIVNRK